MTGPLISPLDTSATWQLFRLRFGAPETRALVFLAHSGDDAMVPSQEGDFWGYRRPTRRMVRDGEFFDVVWVSLTERRISVDIPRRPPKPPARYGVAWKISNPVVAARSQLTEEQARQLVVRHIDEHAGLPGVPDPLRKPPPHPGTTEVEPPGRLRVIDGSGLAYWFLDPPAALLPASGVGSGPALPTGFGEDHREAYRFYREVVAGGPVGLAALWLLHRPEEAKDVLDWTVTHRDLLADRNDWEHSLAAALKSLTPEDRSFVGANMARVLSDVGVPQGDEVLRRIGHSGGTDDGGAAPYEGFR
ncbi:hypothetical protein ACFVWY_26460 [Streptomyces sp. NPDC058195]|uniref:hypothetical protein n=1 Tax=Streptomyces sp. NPDC058195 TaxID=3346375 RepID=UPI0036E1FB28